MREIKCRGLMKNNVWAFGWVSYDLPNSTAYYKDYSQRICWHPDTGGQANVPVKNGTLGQFTGLFDINGQEIYEGDILAWRDVNGFRDDSAAVEWVQDHCSFMLVDDDKNIYDDMMNFFPGEWIEVIGNIHQPQPEEDV